MSFTWSQTLPTIKISWRERLLGRTFSIGGIVRVLKRADKTIGILSTSRTFTKLSDFSKKRREEHKPLDHDLSIIDTLPL